MKLNNLLRVIFASLLIAMVFCFSSCQRPPQVEKHFHTKDSTTITTEKLVKVELPGAVVSAPINYDSIKALLAGAKTKVYYYKDPSGIAELKIWKDSITGKLMAQCEALQRTTEVRVEEKEIRIKEMEKDIIQLKAQREGWLKRQEDKLKDDVWRIFWIGLTIYAVWELIKHFGGPIPLILKAKNIITSL